MLAGDQLGGEGGLFASLHTNQGVIQSLDQGIVTNLVGQSLGSCLVNSLAIDGGGQVDRDEVALLHGTISRLQGAEASLQVLQLRIDGLVISLQRRNLNGDVREVRNLNLRANINLSSEGNVLAILQLRDLDLRLAESLHVVLLDSLAVARRQHLVDDLIQDNTTAQASFQNLRRNLALAEARHVYLLREGGVGLVELWLKLLEWNLNRELGAGGAQLFYRALHECTLLCIDSFLGATVVIRLAAPLRSVPNFIEPMASATRGGQFSVLPSQNPSRNLYGKLNKSKARISPSHTAREHHFAISRHRAGRWRHQQKG